MYCIFNLQLSLLCCCDLKSTSDAGNKHCQLTAASTKLSFIVDFSGCKLDFFSFQNKNCLSDYFSDLRKSSVPTPNESTNQVCNLWNFFVNSSSHKRTLLTLFTTVNIQQFTHTKINHPHCRLGINNI